MFLLRPSSFLLKLKKPCVRSLDEKASPGSRGLANSHAVILGKNQAEI
jgi:hypothetical protein